jgi:transposase
MWLAGRLVPNHKTIADFRKDNGPAIRKVCAATSGRGSGVVGYNVQVAVDTELIVTHEVTNTGSDRSQLAKVATSSA